MTFQYCYVNVFFFSLSAFNCNVMNLRRTSLFVEVFTFYYWYDCAISWKIIFFYNIRCVFVFFSSEYFHWLKIVSRKKPVPPSEHAKSRLALFCSGNLQNYVKVYQICRWHVMQNKCKKKQKKNWRILIELLKTFDKYLQ